GFSLAHKAALIPCWAAPANSSAKLSMPPPCRSAAVGVKMMRPIGAGAFGRPDGKAESDFETAK
ncbi:MAG: hypothetical protein ACRED8_10990, partial [Caulobacteraceae bacterium]